MIDSEFARAVERGQVSPAAFDHRAHLRLALVYLVEAEGALDQALCRMREALVDLTIKAGKPDKYHETLTVFWLSAVADACGSEPPETVDDLLARRPGLGNKNLAASYYSQDRLSSDTARHTWVTPDLRPFPERLSQADQPTRTGTRAS